MNTIKIPAKKLRIQLGELLEQARWGNVRFLITKKARPVAYLTGVQWEEKQRKRVKRREPFPFKGHPLGEFKTPLTREYMYDERLTRTLGH